MSRKRRVNCRESLLAVYDASLWLKTMCVYMPLHNSNRASEIKRLYEYMTHTNERQKGRKKVMNNLVNVTKPIVQFFFLQSLLARSPLSSTSLLFFVLTMALYVAFDCVWVCVYLTHYHLWQGHLRVLAKQTMIVTFSIYLIGIGKWQFPSFHILFRLFFHVVNHTRINDSWFDYWIASAQIYLKWILHFDRG